MNTESEQKSPIRQHLVTIPVQYFIDRIEAHRITLQPGQSTGLHIHTRGTIGYVIDGEIAFQLDGEPEAILRGGDAFFEPAGRRIQRFNNLSQTQTATFLACYPLTGDDTVITMIDSQALD